MQHDTTVYQVLLEGTMTRLIASLLYLRCSKVRYLKFYRLFSCFTMKCFLDEALMFWEHATERNIIDNTNLARLRGSHPVNHMIAANGWTQPPGLDPAGAAIPAPASPRSPVSRSRALCQAPAPRRRWLPRLFVVTDMAKGRQESICPERPLAARCARFDPCRICWSTCC